MNEKLSALIHRRSTLRVAVTAALIAYPLGCVSFLLLPGDLEFVGGLLLALALLAFVLTLPSSLQRIAFVPQFLAQVDDLERLDELEIDLRRRAQAFAYQVLSILVLGGIMYLTIASDRVNAGEGSLWLPRVDDHWLAILFGVLVYVMLLPMAYLAWKLPTPVPDDEPADRNASKAEPGPREALILICMSVGLAVGLLFFDDAALWMMIGSLVGLGLDGWGRIRRNRSD